MNDHVEEVGSEGFVLLLKVLVDDANVGRICGIYTPWKCNSSPLKIYNPKRRVVFQPSFFRGYVKLREGIPWESRPLTVFSIVFISTLALLSPGHRILGQIPCLSTYLDPWLRRERFLVCHHQHVLRAFLEYNFQVLNAQQKGERKPRSQNYVSSFGLNVNAVDGQNLAPLRMPQICWFYTNIKTVVPPKSGAKIYHHVTNAFGAPLCSFFMDAHQPPRLKSHEKSVPKRKPIAIPFSG